MSHNRKHSGAARLLIAHSNDDFRALLEQGLEQRSYGYENASSSEELRRLVDADSFDLLVLELAFEENLTELLKQIENAKPDQAVVLVARPESHAQAYEMFRCSQALDVLELSASKPCGADIEPIFRLIDAFQTPSEQDSYLSEQCKFELCVTSKEAAEGRFHFLAAEKLYKMKRLSKNEKLRLELVFQECFANALEHGNLELESVWKEEIDEEGRDRFTKEKKIRLSLAKYAQRKLWVRSSYDDSTLELEFQDEGPGFEVKYQKKRADDEVVPHGRGLQILFSVMDTVEFEDGGRRLRMTKSV